MAKPNCSSPLLFFLVEAKAERKQLGINRKESFFMASTYGYTDEASLENLLLIDIDSSFSNQIDTWISTAEDEVNNYLGYTTVSGCKLETITNELCESVVDGDLNLIIQPRKYPVESLQSINIVKGSLSLTLNLDAGGGNTRYMIPTRKNIIIYPNFELYTTTSTLLYNFANIKFSRFFTKVCYVGGYSTIPRPISLATTYYTADTFMRQANKEGLTALTQGRISKRWAETTDGESSYIKIAKRMLNPYRLVSAWV
ncbi:MAG: hypothetical protein WC549_00630 [Actinomycetota bacterium]